MARGDNEIETLVETIKTAISTRGFYILLDSRLDLICGEGSTNPADPANIKK